MGGSSPEFVRSSATFSAGPVGRCSEPRSLGRGHNARARTEYDRVASDAMDSVYFSLSSRHSALEWKDSNLCCRFCWMLDMVEFFLRCNLAARNQPTRIVMSAFACCLP